MSSKKASRKAKKKEGGKQRSQRATSNVFSMFDQSQIAEFKEAFTMMDANRDGFIDSEDLKDTYASLGRVAKDAQISEMLKESNGPVNFQVFLGLFGDKLSGNVKSSEDLQKMIDDAPSAINFTVFLAMMGDKIKGTDPEETILNAFKLLDPDNKGVVSKSYLSEILMSQADRFNQEEINQMCSIAPIDVAGNLDYKSLCYVITHGQEEE